MRIFMQTVPHGTEAPRYCHLILQQDLLGGWSLTRRFGVGMSGEGSRVAARGATAGLGMG